MPAVRHGVGKVNEMRTKHILIRLASVFFLFVAGLPIAYGAPARAAAAIEAEGCGYHETYGPYGAVAGRQTPDLLLALTVCLPDQHNDGLLIDNRPRIDWGDGTDWRKDGVRISGCQAGFFCKFYGRHTYQSPGRYTVRLRYYMGAGLYYTSKSPITIDVFSGAPQAAIDRANWMGSMGSTIGTLPLTQVAIPGTHDSGAYGFTAGSIIAPDFPPIADQLRGLANDAEDEKSNCPDGLEGTCEEILEGFAATVRGLAAGFDPGRRVDTVSGDIGQFVADMSNAQGRGIGQQLHDQGLSPVAGVRIKNETARSNIVSACQHRRYRQDGRAL